MGSPDAFQSLASAIGVCSHHDLEIVSKTLSYLGVSPIPSDPVKTQPLPFTISVDGGSADCALQARFDHNLKKWSLQSSHDGYSTSAPAAKNTSAVLDWTTLLPSTPHVDFLKSRDWAATALGPMSSWSLPLRLMVTKMLSDPRPANLYVGPDRIAVYNEPFSVIAASRHPFMMGATCQAALPATWPILSAIFDEIERTDEPFSAGSFEMGVEKMAGHLEEAWYDGVFYPVKDENGHVFALYNSGFETTDSIMSLRRSRLLHLVSAEPDFREVTPWQHIINACSEFGRDIPLLLLYRAADLSSDLAHCTLHLQGSLGVSTHHPAIPQSLELHEGNNTLVSTFRQANARRNYILLEHTKDDLPDFLAKDIEWRGHGEIATHTVVAPLFVTGLLAGFLVVGLNPRRPYDDYHEEFVDDFVRAAAGMLASNLSFEQSRIREERLTEQLTKHEKFLAKIAELVPVGIARHTHEGLITWANSRFWEITGIANIPEDFYKMSSFDCVPDDVKQNAADAFYEAASQQTTKMYEFPLKKTWRPPGSFKDEPAWVLVSFTGEPTSVLGCVTDISHLKWSERLQAQVAEDAREAKIQQERFMDMTSHELRNPLSAILQCADDILTSCQAQSAGVPSDSRASEGMEESARTILFCAAHQQRVINDILTVSKLDSSLLEISPIAMNTSIIVNQAVYMYKSELAAHKISIDISEKPSFINLEADYVFSDPSRLTQILINLFTNAIKFTKAAKKREIRVRYGALTSPPSETTGDLHWFPSGRDRRPLKDGQKTDRHKQFFLGFEVEDTGEGISKDGMSQLFKRFSQASPMTHIKYGGSGLGLFISRELTELQGGMVGAKSVPHEGTTFVFYIETRLASDTEKEELHSSLHGGIQSSWMPAKSPMPHILPEAPSPTPAQSEGDTPKPTQPKRKNSAKPAISLSVLLVEDNILNQNILKRQLQRLGCTVYVANHGGEALDLLKTTRFWHDNADEGADVDIVLMDWEMPVMDGLTSTRQLRDWEASGQINKHLTVLGTTANARPGQVKIALTAGMDDVIAKPFTVSSLMARIKALRAV